MVPTAVLKDASVREGAILDGPSKFDLMTSLMQGRVGSAQTVRFVLTMDDDGERVEVEVLIDSLKRVDGHGQEWEFTGYLLNDSVRSYITKADYGLKRRLGRIRIERAKP